MKYNLPELSYERAKHTWETVHLWSQIIGKIKLKCAPEQNHYWHVVLHQTPRGLSTLSLPYANKHFEILLDFIDDKLIIRTSEDEERSFSLIGIAVSQFYFKIMEELWKLTIQITINEIPNELEEVTAFSKDTEHKTYQPEEVKDLHQVLLFCTDVLNKFKGSFVGKCSPVHFFWGSFDLALTRFSGRTAPKHPGGVPHLPDRISQEAYSHEVSSCGFWPGNDMLPEAAFYSYAYPEPDRLKTASVKPAAAYYNKDLGEFILPYENVRSSADPEKMLLEFLISTYTAVADLGKWDRKSLERAIA
jgi:hypothetical protein